MSCVQPRGKAAAPRWAWVSVEASQRELWVGECPDCGPHMDARTHTHAAMWTTRGVFCEPGPHRKHTGCSFSLHVYAELYMCGNFFFSFCGTSVQTELGAVATVSQCCASAAYLSFFLSSVRFLFFSSAQVMHACARVHFHVCSADILRFVPSDKRDSVETARAPRGNICLCAVPPQPRSALAPPTCQGPVPSHRESQMATAHRQGHTVTRTDARAHTHMAGHRAGSARAKVNR